MNFSPVSDEALFDTRTQIERIDEDQRSQQNHICSMTNSELIGELYNILEHASKNEVEEYNKQQKTQYFMTLVELTSEMNEIPDDIFLKTHIIDLLREQIDMQIPTPRKVRQFALKIIYNLLLISQTFALFLLENEFLTLVDSLLHCAAPDILAIVYCIISVLPYDNQKFATAFSETSADSGLINDILTDFTGYTHSDHQVIPHYSKLVPYIIEDFFSIVSSCYIPNDLKTVIFKVLTSGIQVYYKNIEKHALRIAEIASIFVQNQGDEAIQILENTGFLSQVVVFLETDVFGEDLKVLALRALRAALTAEDPVLRQRVLHFLSLKSIVQTFLVADITSHIFPVSATIINNLIPDFADELLKHITVQGFSGKVNECLENGAIATKIQIFRLALTFGAYCSISGVRELFASRILVDLIDVLEISPPQAAKILIKLACSALLKVEEYGLKDYANYTDFKEKFHEILLDFQDSNDLALVHMIPAVLEEVYCEGDD